MDADYFGGLDQYHGASGLYAPVQTQHFSADGTLERPD